MEEMKFNQMGVGDTTSTVSITESRISAMLSAGQVEEALMEILRHGIAPSSIYAKQMRAMCHMRKKEFDKAKEIVNDLVRRSQDALSMKMLGDISFLSVEYEEAEKWYRKSLEKVPGEPNVVHDLAVAIVSQGKLDDAIRIFRQACALQPGNPSFRHHLAMMLVLNHQYREGWTLMESRLEIPRYLRRLSCTGEILARAGCERKDHRASLRAGLWRHDHVHSLR